MLEVKHKGWNPVGAACMGWRCWGERVAAARGNLDLGVRCASDSFVPARTPLYTDALFLPFLLQSFAAFSETTCSVPTLVEQKGWSGTWVLVPPMLPLR